MSKPIVFGEISGVKEKDRFKDRKAIMKAGLHRTWVNGIDAKRNEGASVIVLSGGYEDDEDYGDRIVYTGAGGKAENSNKQVKDQSWDNIGNEGLRLSENLGLPVRVIRGAKHKSKFSPKTGYEYAGLYSVVRSFDDVGKSGFKICRFELIYSGENPDRLTAEESVDLDYNNRSKKRQKGTVVRIIRDSKLAQDIKKLYNFECQVCGLAINTKNGGYAEGAHIRPLGTPHNGDDNPSNLLCLCPNHHVMLDKGSFSIKNNFKLVGHENGVLFRHAKHKLKLENLKYHRDHFGYK